MQRTPGRRLLQQLMSTSAHAAEISAATVAAVDVDLCPCSGRQGGDCCSRRPDGGI